MNAAPQRCERLSRSGRRRRGTLPVTALPAAALMLAAAAGGSACAIDSTWDNGFLAASQDWQITPSADGIWSVSRTVDSVLIPASYNWTVVNPVSQQTVPAQWTNGNTAVFGPTDPFVPWAANIDGTVTAAGLTFNGNTTIGSSSGTPGTDSLRFTANGASLTAGVASGVTATVNADILPGNTAVDQSNVLVKTGAGTLALAGTTRLATSINSGTKGPKNSYFTVNGGGTMEIAGRFISTIDNATYTMYQCPTSYVGDASSNNTIRVTGGGSMWTNDVTFGGTANLTSFDNNSIILSAPGTSAKPTWMIFGDSPQINMVSSGNLLRIENGAYMGGTGGSGIPQWTIGTNDGNNGNSIVVDGTGSTLSKANGAVWVGAAGSGNSLIVRNGATYAAGYKIGVGMNGGDDNYQLVTGAGSAQNAGFGGTNAWLQVGLTGGSLRNSLRVESGGALYLGGNPTNTTIGVGMAAGANDNYIRVAGTNSVFKFVHTAPLVIGGVGPVVNGVPTTITDGGSGNHLDVVDGGRLELDNTGGVDPRVMNGSTYLALAGTASTFNLGNGTGISTVVLGKTTYNNYGAGLGLLKADSVLRVNSGRIIAGTAIANNDALISGPGAIVLDGPAYVSVPFFSNRITSAISGTGSLTKEGDGTLVLTNTANAYAGDTIVKTGYLEIQSPFLSNLSTVKISSGALLLLNFTGTNVVAGLELNGVAMPPGTYTWETGDSYGFLSGAGALQVVTPVPEPGAVVLAGAAAALAGCGLRCRRRLR